MGHWIIVPIVLPALVAPLIIMFTRDDLVLARTLSFVSSAIVLVVAIALGIAAVSGAPEVYELGNWPAPFGIVLVLDRLSALMVILTAALALIVLLYAASGWDGRGRHFHALFQFELMGLNGAFLTGDVFNLFVFFEVLLIASYGLMLHGGGAERLKAGFQYVAVNLLGSTLFLFAVGLIYAVTGTLNMADLAVKVPQVEPGDSALLHAGAALLLLVFAIKAALVPVHFWLTGTYAAAMAPVAALFAIMTKVGAYSIIRICTLVFGGDAGEAAWFAEPWLMPAAIVTLAVGMVGVISARTLGRMVAYSVVGSMGTLLIAVSLFTTEAMSAALYYLLHSTVAGAALFMITGLIAERRGPDGDAIVASRRFRNSELLSGLFFLAAIAMVGLPPLSGFLAKLLILDSARDSEAVTWIWAVILTTSLIATIGFTRAGSRLFWKTAASDDMAEAPVPTHGVFALAAAGILVTGTIALTGFAAQIGIYLDATAAQLFDPSAYIAAVLGDSSVTVR